MKIGKLVEPEFKKTLKKLSKEKIPVKAAFKLKGILLKVEDEAAKYEELRLEYLSKYADKDAKGDMIMNELGNAQITPENLAQFYKDMNELKEVEVDLESLSVSELGDKAEMSADDLIVLSGIVV